MEKKFLKIGEFAREIGVHPNTVRNMEKEGKITPHHKNERGDRYFTWQQVNDYFDNCNRKVGN